MMKKLLFTLITLLVGPTSAFAQARIAEETRAIESILQQETESFVRNDLEALRALYIVDRPIPWMCSGRYVYLRTTGWNTLVGNLEKSFGRDRDPEFAGRRYDTIVTDGSVACVSVITERCDGQARLDSVERRILVNVDGKWKLLAVEPGNDKLGCTELWAPVLERAYERWQARTK